MKSIDAVTRWLHIIVATLAVWSQDFVQRIFTRLSIGQYYLLGVVILAIIVIQAVDRLANWTINTFKWIRVFLAGKDDIEGDWVNIVVNTQDPTQIIAVEYCRIRYRGGQYVLTGDTWTMEGKWVSDFATEGSSFHGRELEYYYRTGVNRVGGFGIILFSPSDSLPTDFICRYVDEDVKAPHVTRGRRVSRRLRRVPQDDRKLAAMTFGETFEQRGLLSLDSALAHYPRP